jgi:hypothetical protein
VKDKYVVLNYAPGGKKREIITGPKKIVDGFPMFAKTIFENGIDCAFETTDNEAFIFCGNECAKTTAPKSRNARLLSGPMLITKMFPILRRTGFENGIDSATRSCYEDNNVYLFKGKERLALDIIDNKVIGRIKISSVYPPLLGTVFEQGIDAAFNTHDEDEAFIFKGKYYAHFNFRTKQFVNGFIKLNP